MATNEVMLIKENSSGDFEIKKFLAESGKVIGFDSNLNPVMMAMASGGGETVINSVTSLTNIDCSLGTYFTIDKSASEALSVINVSAAKYYVFAIKNTSAASITVTMPTGCITANSTVAIAAGLTREFSMINAGSVNRFQVSGEVHII
jgi:hypothetical protein